MIALQIVVLIIMHKFSLLHVEPYMYVHTM